MSDEMRQEFEAFRQETRTRFDAVEAKLHGVAVAVARHEERFDRIETQLKKLDVIETLQRQVAAMVSEQLSIHRQRTLIDQAFRDQRETLLDHEARITRLERRAKPS